MSNFDTTPPTLRDKMVVYSRGTYTTVPSVIRSELITFCFHMMWSFLLLHDPLIQFNDPYLSDNERMILYAYGEWCMFYSSHMIGCYFLIKLCFNFFVCLFKKLLQLLVPINHFNRTVLVFLKISSTFFVLVFLKNFFNF